MKVLSKYTAHILPLILICADDVATFKDTALWSVLTHSKVKDFEHERDNVQNMELFQILEEGEAPTDRKLTVLKMVVPSPTYGTKPSS
jgi:hypothetical protein